MNIKKRIKGVFVKPERKLVELKPEFQKLRQSLQRALGSKDPLTDIVYFFDTVSKWHDRGLVDVITAFEKVNYGQYDELLKKLMILQMHFVNAGRDEYGWNRTKRGEMVMENKVFLGNVYGLFTHPASFWKKGKDEKKGGWGFSNMEHLSAYDVVSQQAQQFMASHAGPMITILDNIAA